MSQKFLLCEPNYFQIEYQINPYMRLDQRVDPEAAISAWHQLVACIVQCGGEVVTTLPQPDCPDMVFTANAGLVIDQHIILSQMQCAERAAEIPWFKTFFEEQGYTVYEAIAGAFEGEAEAVCVDGRWYVGYGFRSDKSFYDDHPFFKAQQKVYCELVSPEFYHLDTCFLSLGDGNALWYPPAFTEKSQHDMQQQGLNLFDVSDADARRFACNSIIIDKHIIVPQGCDATTPHLRELGFTIHELDMSQFLKAGGACNCMVLNLS
ncbi:MAG: hypothetical protein COB66_05580 [Coxiella sp. (in: Bacteria)]|nr:MAG: hypothetical protein COB66_05580 [Coxiella sp. (in: g-proteobacteria)]